MSNTFFASDHHFGHKNILTFPLRRFSDVEEMNEFMVEQHNRMVSPKDKTYFLGDVAFGSNNLKFLDRMNGEKILIKGNHDHDKLSNYQKYFKDVRGSHQFAAMLLTHIPVHPQSLSRWKVNVHGHTHAKKVQISTWEDTGIGMYEFDSPDPSYYCVCMEQHNYTPVSIDTIQKYVANL